MILSPSAPDAGNRYNMEQALPCKYLIPAALELQEEGALQPDLFA